MEIIGKVSKGSIMDQIYVPKKRIGFDIGDYVVIKPLEGEKLIQKPFFYNVKSIEPIKLDIMKRIMHLIDQQLKQYENIIITGSFVDKGFSFNDIDIILVSKKEPNLKYVEKIIQNKIKIKIHLVLIDNKTLLEGLSTDPLYQMMLSKCIAKKRFIYKTKHKINYKLLDLHLLKSKTLINNFDMLNGDEKYSLTRNLIAIYLYLNHPKISKELVDKQIKHIFNLDIQEIKQNMLDKKSFLNKYKSIYQKAFNKIMRKIKDGAK